MEPITDSVAPTKPDWALVLPRTAFFDIMRVLQGALPPPALDEPGEWTRRDQAAMAAVGALQPATAAAGRLAALCVAGEAHAMDCLALAAERRGEWEVTRQCRAQAMGMMREARSSLRALQGMQAERRSLAKNNEAAAQGEWVEHVAVNLMAEALVARPVAAVPKAGLVPAGGIELRDRRVETTARFYEPEVAGVVAAPFPRPPPTSGGGEGRA